MSAKLDEFSWIDLIRPLASRHPAALALLDDAAEFVPPAGKTLVLTHDTIVEGVHFLSGDSPARAVRKLIRVNLSDLAAKAAVPEGYLLSVAWPQSVQDEQKREFVQALVQEADIFGVVPLGGDTVRTSGPLVLGATFLGTCPLPGMIRRSGAKAGDLLCVTGPIGEGWLGLRDAKQGRQTAQRSHFDLPVPHLSAIAALQSYASACADISDGLFADAMHIARASGLGLVVNLDQVPLSDAGRAHVSATGSRGLLELLAGGDDYVLAVAVPPEKESEFRTAMDQAGLSATVCGLFTSSPGLTARLNGQDLPVAELGWKHL
jgi:thiamine-monophosphate kinase